MKITCFASVLALSLLTVVLAAADENAALLASGRVDDAIAQLHGQINAFPNDALAHNLLCRAYFSLGNWDQGISDCERAVSLAPANSQYHLWLGRIYGEKADTAGVVTAAGLARRVRKEFEAAVQLNPNNIDARTDLAEFYVEAPGIMGGGHDKAQKQADSLFRLDPAKAYWVKARIAEKRREFPTAEKQYQGAVEASHGAASAWLNLGLFYRHRQRWGEMEQALAHLRTARLDRPEALVDAAEILIASERDLVEANRLLRAYLSSNFQVEQAPAFKVHYLLGKLIEKLGDKQNAAAEYRSALVLAREFQPAQEALRRLR
ncbi:MAG: tetratricopeptide repeat protein [Acidobacteria bacterium]|nr:tetratricopeptide repeat protein [Acidobacteriota bacterium]